MLSIGHRKRLSQRLSRPGYSPSFGLVGPSWECNPDLVHMPFFNRKAEAHRAAMNQGPRQLKAPPRRVDVELTRQIVSPLPLVEHEQGEPGCGRAGLTLELPGAPHAPKLEMDLIPTSLSDCCLVRPSPAVDERGFFLVTFRQADFAAQGITHEFVQDNHSGSRKGVLRGLHYQIRRPQGKLVRAVVGEIYDVAVDLRRSSRTFGEWIGVLLSAANRTMLWVPPGFAHGFYTTSEWAEVVYKVTDYYAPEFDRCLLWSDPALGIDWPLVDGQLPILSDKDARGNILAQADTFP